MTFSSSDSSWSASGFAGGLPAQGLTAFGKFIRTRDGERLITEGEAQDALYLILSGHLVVSTSSGGRTVRLATLGEGDSLGEVNLFDPSTASADVTSAGEAVIWRIRRNELHGLLASDPEAGIALMKSLITQLSARIRLMNHKLKAAEAGADDWDSTTS